MHRTVQTVFAAACLLGANASFAEVPLYDFRQPVRDGVILVGMECNHKSQSLEFGIYFAGKPPTKRMDLWKTSDLVEHDAQTWMVSAIRHVERTCKIGTDRYRVRFDGLPGAANAMWMCGAASTAKATVWRNSELVFEQELARCGVDNAVRLVRFGPGSNTPTLIRDEQ